MKSNNDKIAKILHMVSEYKLFLLSCSCSW